MKAAAVRVSGMDKEYLFDSGTDLGREQLAYLQILFDAQTTACIDATGVGAGQGVMDLGAGGGSITRHLAERTGPTGRVVAVDLRTEYLPEHPGVEVHQHDINNGLPADGPYDLIHARMLLMHLTQRKKVLSMLAEALAPGGWLVIGELLGTDQEVVSAPCESDRLLFERVQSLAHGFARRSGVAMDWAPRVDSQLAAAGLINVATIGFSQTATGGDVGCLLNRNYVRQIETGLLEGTELTEAELKRYGDLLLDPRFRCWFYPFICSRGQKPC